MPRIYTEIRISHNTEEEKKTFAEQLRIQAEKLNTDRTGYIKLVIALDAATGIISRLDSTHKNNVVQANIDYTLDKNEIDIKNIGHEEGRLKYTELPYKNNAVSKEIAGEERATCYPQKHFEDKIGYSEAQQPKSTMVKPLTKGGK